MLILPNASSSRRRRMVLSITNAMPHIIAGEKESAKNPPPVFVWFRIKYSAIIKYTMPQISEKIKSPNFFSIIFEIPFIQFLRINYVTSISQSKQKINFYTKNTYNYCRKLTNYQFFIKNMVQIYPILLKIYKN